MLDAFIVQKIIFTLFLIFFLAISLARKKPLRRLPVFGVLYFVTLSTLGIILQLELKIDPTAMLFFQAALLGLLVFTMFIKDAKAGRITFALGNAATKPRRNFLDYSVTIVLGISFFTFLAVNIFFLVLNTSGY